jgi:LuxR family transcriptional regulator, maltose regulon positive regulatory protein
MAQLAQHPSPSREGTRVTAGSEQSAAPALVPRRRLTELLERGTERPLTLISAPAGWGKTALVSEWRRSCAAPGPIAWLTLERGRGARRKLWTDLVAAVAAAHPAFAALAVPPRGSLDAFRDEALAILSEVQEPLVMVVDDFHEVNASVSMENLDWLLEHGPPSLRLVLATRSDPTIRLQRLRTHDRILEIRAADLAFTLEEAVELLARFDLPADDVESLLERTAGWAAGLRLAELSLADHDDPHAFVTGFAGNDRAVSDYLITEVVSHQSAETLDFMLRTCLSERVNGDLADALTGASGGQQKLRELEARGAFVSRVDHVGEWYQYLPVFAEVLRAELARRLPDEVRSLHCVAGQWHADHGKPLDAVRHAVAASDWELAAEVIGEHWLVLVARGAGATLRDLTERIPAEAVNADAELALAQSGLLLEGGDLPAAEAFLLRAHELSPSLPEIRRRRFAVTSTATALYHARLLGDVAEAVSAARLALSENWDTSVAVEVRALTLANLGVAEFWTSDWEAAGDHLQQAAGLALECSNDFVLFLAESYAAGVDVRAGRLGEAWSRARTAIQLAERRGWTAVAHLAIAHAVLATVHLWRNELDEADGCIETAREILRGSAEPLLGPAVAHVEASLLLARGDAVTALNVLRGATAANGLPTFLRVANALIEAEVWLALGEPDRARKTLADIENADASDVPIGLARLELASGDPVQALKAVATFLADEREAVFPFARTEAWIMAALARDAIHDEPGALRALDRGLDLAEPRGYSNVILRCGAPARSLLRRHIASGSRHRSFAGELLNVLDSPTGPSRNDVAPLLEPLSERELAVLRFLPTMMSNAEIASEMFVSVNTVKTHLKHVYRKLDVADRRDAVRRGRRLRLLTPGLADH